MKITFIYLPHPYLKQPNAQVPLGILYLKSIIDRSYFDVDCEVKNYSNYTVKQAINDLPESNIFGITVTSLELLEANNFAKLIKQKYPDSKIILGGAGIDQHNAFIDYVDFNYINSCFIGEAESRILDILNDYHNHDNLMLYYKGKPFNCLNSIPFPDRKCLDDNQGGNIFAYNKNYIGYKSTVILSSRGCPFNCYFCSSPKYKDVKPVRFRSPESVYQELKQVRDELGIYQFRFSDDNFTSRPFDELQKLCNLLKQLEIVWRVSIRVKPFDYKIAKLLKDSGCVEVSFGIESFDNNVLAGLNKRTTAEDNENALKIAHEVGLITRVLFMIRTPFQSPKTVDINIEYLERTPYSIIACTSFVPLPGSEIWKNPDKFNIEILTRKLSKYNFYFYNKEGENELFNVIKIKNRSLKELNNETIKFKEYLKITGKLNMG